MLTALRGATAGQFLQGVDGSDVAWGNAADKSSSSVQTFVGALVAKMLSTSYTTSTVATNVLPATSGATRITATDGSSVSNITGSGGVATFLVLINVSGSNVPFVAGGGVGGISVAFTIPSGQRAILFYDVTSQVWIPFVIGTSNPPAANQADKASTSAQSFAGGVQSTNATQGVGYAIGAGNAYVQATSKATTVVVTTPTGQITMNGAALASGASVSFTVTGAINGTDLPIVACVNNPNYRVEVESIESQGNPNNFRIRVTNISGGSLSDALNIQYAIIKGATS